MYPVVQRTDLRHSFMGKRLPLADSRFFMKSPPTKMQTLFKK